MRRAAVVALVALLPAVGCGSNGGDRGGPITLVDEPRTVTLGLIGAPLAVDGAALVMWPPSGPYAPRPTRSALRRRADASAPTRRAVVGGGLAARDGRAAVAMSAPLRLTVAHRVLEASSPCGARGSSLSRVTATIAWEGLSPQPDACASGPGLRSARDVRTRAARTPDAAPARHGRARAPSCVVGSASIARSGSSPSRSAGGSAALARSSRIPEEIEIVGPTGHRTVIRRSSTEVFVGAEINDHGDLLVHAASEHLRTSLVRRDQPEPVESPRHGTIAPPALGSAEISSSATRDEAAGRQN